MRTSTQAILESGSPCRGSETFPLPKCRMIRHYVGNQHVTTTQPRVALPGADNFNFICDNVVSRNDSESYLRWLRAGADDFLEEISAGNLEQ
jgi:hypothetical protein